VSHEVDAAEPETPAAALAKPLPPEPALWGRLPPTWRQRSFQGLGWFSIAAFLIWSGIARRAGEPPDVSFTVTCVVVGVVWMAVSLPGSLVDRVRAARLEIARRRNPGEPWVWDHRWDPRGVSGSPLRRLFRVRPRFAIFLILPVIYTVLGRMTWSMLQTYWLGAGLVATWIAWQAWRTWGVGTGHVSFDRFPFHPGERVTLRFGMSPGGANFERVAFCLRHVQETPPGRFAAAHTVIWRLGLHESRPPGDLPGGDHFVTLEFDVPATAHGTCLSGPRPAYWALDVLANTSAGPYVESFLIPIYARPAA